MVALVDEQEQWGKVIVLGTQVRSRVEVAPDGVAPVDGEES